MSNNDVPLREAMPTIICENSLDSIRKRPTIMPNWYEGRARAAAMIHPTPFNVGAANEIRFLTGDYARRHYHV